MTSVRTLEDLLCLTTDTVPGLRAAVMAPCSSGPPGPDWPDLRVRVSEAPTTQALGKMTAEAIAETPMYTRPARRDANRAAIDALLDYWRSAYPEAGRAYWSLRCWGILIWQPIYLSVIAVHAAQRVVSLDSFAQSIDNGWTGTLRLADHVPQHADTTRAISMAALQVQACCEQIFAELSTVIRTNTHAARCMQADCALAALLAVRTRDPGLTNPQCESLGQQWLAALSLAGRGAFFSYPCTDGSNALALDRQTCCYHYRRRDGDLCATCPRLEKHERTVRLNVTRDAAQRA